MKAAQWDPKQGKVVVNTIPVPELKPHQILVKLASASLCHSDIIPIENPDYTEPFTLGHEGAGYCQTVGSAVPRDKIDFNEGDPIGFLYINNCCFECEGCQIHNIHCENGKSAVAGFGEFGFFAEYAPVDWQNVCLLPKELDPKKSSAIFCAGITAHHAVKSCNLKPGQTLAIIGAGGLGQLAAQYAKALGLVSIAIDINDATLEACKAQGATHTFNSMSDSDYVTKIKALTPKKLGVHAAAVFSNALPAYNSAPSLLRPGGLWIFIGICGKPVEVSTFALATGTYRIASDSTGTPQRMKGAVDFTAQHGIVPDVEVRSGLESVNSMVEDMRAGRVRGRMGVVFD